MRISFIRNKAKELTDNELIDKFKSSGDTEILGKLYSRYTHLVYGVCLKYLKNRDDSKDAVIDIFERLITINPEQEISNFRGWLHVVTRNHCLMELRSVKRQEKNLQEWSVDPSGFMEYEADLHPIDKEGNKLDDALNKCIEKLREEQRHCIRLFYYGNKCYSEIANELGIDEKKVKSHLQNGKRNLKICLEETDEK